MVTYHSDSPDNSESPTLYFPGSLKDFVGDANDDSTTSNTRKRNITLIVGISIKLIIISIILIILFAHPQKPQFRLQDATFFTFNLSTAPPNYLNSTLQITITSKNPNDGFGIYYDDMGIYAEYMNQPISYQIDIPSVYQGHLETNVWSLLINGTNVPIAPYNVYFLRMDQSMGIINLTIKLYGHLRWTIGSLNTRKYRVHILCNAIIDFRGDPFVLSPFINVKYLLYRQCTVDV